MRSKGRPTELYSSLDKADCTCGLVEGPWLLLNMSCKNKPILPCSHYWGEEAFKGLGPHCSCPEEGSESGGGHFEEAPEVTLLWDPVTPNSLEPE